MICYNQKEHSLTTYPTPNPKDKIETSNPKLTLTQQQRSTSSSFGQADIHDHHLFDFQLVASDYTDCLLRYTSLSYISSQKAGHNTCHLQIHQQLTQQQRPGRRMRVRCNNGSVVYEEQSRAAGGGLILASVEATRRQWDILVGKPRSRQPHSKLRYIILPNLA